MKKKKKTKTKHALGEVRDFLGIRDCAKFILWHGGAKHNGATTLF